MGWLTRLSRRARLIADRQRVDAAMHDEMGFHVEQETNDRIRAGATPEEAKRLALAAFGGVEVYKEEARAGTSLYLQLAVCGEQRAPSARWNHARSCSSLA
jgi:hypothetical protein